MMDIYQRLNTINPEEGLKRGNHTIALEPATQDAIQQLQAHLGDSAREVTPRFETAPGGTVRLVALDTGPEAHAVDALNKLNDLLKGSPMRKTDASHGFNPRQTSAILQALEQRTPPGPIDDSQRLHIIDANAGLKRKGTSRTVPLEPTSKMTIGRLQEYLGADAREVTPVFELVGDNRAKLVSLDTGPEAHAVGALNKLNDLIKETPHRKREASHGFDATQTAAIAEALPLVARRM